MNRADDRENRDQGNTTDENTNETEGTNNSQVSGRRNQQEESDSMGADES